MNENELVNIRQLAEELVSKVGLKLSKKQADKSLNALVDIISVHLKNGNRVKINGLGTFEKKTRLGRKGVDPRDCSKEIIVPPTLGIKFKSSFTLKRFIRAHATE